MICTILVNFNGLHDTLRCISALNHSTLMTDVIVVDNGSADAAIEQVNDSANVTLIRLSENIGFSKGNNVGIEYALALNKYSHLLILNNDAIVHSTTVESMFVALDNQPEYAICCPRIVFAEAPNLLWYGGGEIDWYRGSAVVPDFKQSSWSSVASCSRPVTFATGCAMLVRCELFEEIGGFDEKYFMYEEDVEFSIRAIKSNYQILYVSDALVYHRGLGSSRDDNIYVAPLAPNNPKLTFFLYHRIYNRLHTVKKHATRFQQAQFALYFPVYWGYKSLKYLAFGRIDAIAAILRAIYDFWKQYFQNIVK